MQYVTDDMDDVFRQAAENYPLDTSGADWNKVASALEGDAPVAAARRNDKRQLLWLLLLLPLALICNRYAGTGNGTLSTAPAPNARTSTSTASAAITADERQTPPSSSSSHVNGSKLLTSPPQQTTTALSGKDQSTRIYTGAAKTAWHGSARINTVDPLTEPVGAPDEIYAAVYGKGDVKNLFTASINGQAPGARVQLPLLHPVRENKAAAASRLPARKAQRFYAGLAGGLDATSVKGESVRRAGYDYGIIAGYDLGAHLSIEAGAFIDRKYYASEGKYFNTTKVYLPPNSAITDVTGRCKMIDIPVVLRYRFTPGAHSSWFVSAGSASYIMQREDYSYLYYYTVSGTSAWYDKKYSHASTDLFSILQLSGGYTHRLGNSTEVRIEPYLKMPLSGVGFGKLPLSSAGLHIGVLRRF